VHLLTHSAAALTQEAAVLPEVMQQKDKAKTQTQTFVFSVPAIHKTLETIRPDKALK